MKSHRTRGGEWRSRQAKDFQERHGANVKTNDSGCKAGPRKATGEVRGHGYKGGCNHPDDDNFFLFPLPSRLARFGLSFRLLFLLLAAASAPSFHPRASYARFTPPFSRATSPAPCRGRFRRCHTCTQQDVHGRVDVARFLSEILFHRVPRILTRSLALCVWETAYRRAGSVWTCLVVLFGTVWSLH